MEVTSLSHGLMKYININAVKYSYLSERGLLHSTTKTTHLGEGLEDLSIFLLLLTQTKQFRNNLDQLKT